MGLVEQRREASSKWGSWLVPRTRAGWSTGGGTAGGDFVNPRDSCGHSDGERWEVPGAQQAERDQSRSPEGPLQKLRSHRPATRSDWRCWVWLRGGG